MVNNIILNCLQLIVSDLTLITHKKSQFSKDNL